MQLTVDDIKQNDSSDDWINKISEIVTGINELLKTFNAGKQRSPIDAQTDTGDKTQKQIKGFLEHLTNNGYGDKKLIDVLSELPVTISQLKGFL